MWGLTVGRRRTDSAWLMEILRRFGSPETTKSLCWTQGFQLNLSSGTDRIRKHHPTWTVGASTEPRKGKAPKQCQNLGEPHQNWEDGTYFILLLQFGTETKGSKPVGNSTIGSLTTTIPERATNHTLQVFLGGKLIPAYQVGQLVGFKYWRSETPFPDTS